MYVVESFLVGTAFGSTARQLRDLGDERFIFPAPVDDDLILHHGKLPGDIPFANGRRGGRWPDRAARSLVIT